MDHEPWDAGCCDGRLCGLFTGFIAKCGAVEFGFLVWPGTVHPPPPPSFAAEDLVRFLAGIHLLPAPPEVLLVDDLLPCSTGPGGPQPGWERLLARLTAMLADLAVRGAGAACSMHDRSGTPAVHATCWGSH